MAAVKLVGVMEQKSQVIDYLKNRGFTVVDNEDSTYDLSHNATPLILLGSIHDLRLFAYAHQLGHKQGYLNSQSDESDRRNLHAEWGMREHWER